MSKYKISTPDSNKGGIKISGIKLDKNPFKILGTVLLEIDRGGLVSYKVIETDFPTCFPLNEKFWSTTDMFCNACNHNIHSYGWNRISDDYMKICFTIGEGYFAVFSKHKIDESHWNIVIYDSSDELLYKEINNYFDVSIKQGKMYYEFIA